MCIAFGNEVDYFKQHLSEIFKDVQDESSSPISFSPTLLEQLLPAFFVSSKLDPPAADDNLTGITAFRNDGYLSFYRSLTNFTVKQYNTLSTAFLERILQQAHSLLPMTKIATCLQLDNGRYNAQHDGCDRLTILLGILLSHFGAHMVDSFLHPLFMAHVFNEKHPQRTDQSGSISSFRNLIQTRGGSFEVDYQQTQPTSSQTQSQWGCTIKYQLARNTPFVMHQRNGQSKKQARVRALQDIHNYYTRNDASLVLHCSSASSTLAPSDQSPHPHGQQLTNHEPEQVVQTLSIPVELLYQYDDADHQQQPSNILSGKRPHDNMTEDFSSHVECNNQISFLTQALLYDFSNLSFNDSHEPSPTSLDSPASIITLKQPPPSLTDSTLPTPTTMSSPSSTHTSSIRTEPMNEEWTDQPMTNKKQRTHVNGLFSQQTDGMLLDQQTTAAAAQPSSAELAATATQMFSRLSDKLRQRVVDLAEQLAQQPSNAKAVLINLAGKLDGGSYVCDMKHIQADKSSTINNGLAYFSATVTFTMDGLTLVLTRHSPKKTDAETTAAFAIFGLLATSSTTIPLHSPGTNIQPSPSPLSHC